MKKVILSILLNFLFFGAFAQISSEINPKYVKIPRYANESAITSSIPSPTSGMLVFNNATSSIWFYNGSIWANTSSGTLSGSGTTNRIPLFTSSGSLANSPISLQPNGESVNIGDNIPASNIRLHVLGKTYLQNGVWVGSVESIEDGGSFEFMFDGTLRPKLNNADNLGTSTYRYNTIFATNGTINTSDANLKTNILNTNYGLKEILKLRPVSFHWKAELPNESAKIGFLAQDLQKIIPEVVVDKEWVYTNDDRSTGHWQPTTDLGVRYSDLIPVTVSAIQEQQKLIDSMKIEIEELKKAILELKK